jgi:amidase
MWNAVSSQLVGGTIDDVHRAYRDGTLTARQLTDAYLERIARHDQALNTIVVLNPGALAEADSLDARLRSEGAFAGPLHGIPVVVKDQAETAGIPTAFGSIVLRDWVPPEDAVAVARLREAGAIILAKTAMPDFATSWHGHSSRSGVTHNPYAVDRDPGGSSGGTAAAVAANLALLGLGEDTGGSLRVPASFCGLVALRTTPGVISRTGFCPLVREQDAPGPLTRSVRDLATALDVLVGWDPKDPFTAAAAIVRRRGSFTDQLRSGGLVGARIGVLRDRFGTAGEPEAAVTEVIDDALVRMRDAGATLVDPVAIDGLDEHLATTFPYFVQSRRELNAFLAARDLPVNDVAELVAANRFWPSLVLMKIIAAGPPDPGSTPEYARLLDARATFQRAVVGVLAAHHLDALVYPTVQIAAPRRADIDAGCWEESEEGVDHPGRRPFPVNVLIASQALLPAITLPVGSTADGLPVGLELLGLPYDDLELVRLAFDVERVAGRRAAPPDLERMETTNAG